MIKQFLYAQLPQSEGRCNICFSSHLRETKLTYTDEVRYPSYVRSRTMNFVVCNDCEYSFCRENFKDYSILGPGSISSSDSCKRVGDGAKPGRELFMVKGAIAVLKRKKLRVLIFAPGNSLDHNLVRNLSAVAECKVTDLLNFQNSEYFVPIDTKEVFDIVIACEVVEHFMSPRKEFSNLFRYLNKKGLLILSTDTRVEGCLLDRLYPFLYGHTSYYSGKALIFLAQMNNVFIDFRTPEGETFKSKLKRYIYMTKSKEVYFDIKNRFSIITHPLSE